MKHLKKSLALLMLLTVIIGSRTFAQDYYFGLKPIKASNFLRAPEVVRYNEYTKTGYEQGNFYDNPLMLDGKAVDYERFNLQTKGELTVVKGAPATGATVQVPFYVYLRRNGDKIFIPGRETPNLKQTKIDLSEIFKHAEHGDHLVIEAVRKEDGAVKTILKLLGGGC